MTIDWMTILVEIYDVDCPSVNWANTPGTAVYSLRPKSLLFVWYDCDERGASQSQCFLY